MAAVFLIYLSLHRPADRCVGEGGCGNGGSDPVVIARSRPVRGGGGWRHVTASHLERGESTPYPSEGRETRGRRVWSILSVQVNHARSTAAAPRPRGAARRAIRSRLDMPTTIHAGRRWSAGPNCPSPLSPLDSLLSSPTYLPLSLRYFHIIVRW